MSEEVPFPVCDWAIQFTEKSCEKVTEGSNWWETGFWHDQVREAEYIRDYLFRAIYGNWSYLKNQSADKETWAKLELSQVSFLAGKRESRRLIGDVFFTQGDIERDYVRYDDALIIGTYSIDQHFPTPKNHFFFPGEEFISTMKHYFNDLGTPRMYLRKEQVPPPSASSTAAPPARSIPSICRSCWKRLNDAPDAFPPFPAVFGSGLHPEEPDPRNAGSGTGT